MNNIDSPTEDSQTLITFKPPPVKLAALASHAAIFHLPLAIWPPNERAGRGDNFLGCATRNLSLIAYWVTIPRVINGTDQ